MAADLLLLKSFVDGQGVGAADYFVYSEDLDTNFSDIETGVNAINAEVKAFAGNNAVLILDALRSEETPVRLTGFVDEESFAPVSFISGDTQIVIPTGVAVTASIGRVELLATATLTGSGAPVTFFVALQVNGTATLETTSAQGVMDLYSVDWLGATFDTPTLLRLETIIPGGDDLFDQQSVVGGVTIPTQDHDRIANRFENIERVLNGLTSNVVPGGPALGSLGLGNPPGFLEEARLSFTSVTVVTVGTAAIFSSVRDSTNSFDISFTGTLPADITVAGAGGLDTGVEAGNTWYAVYVIGDSTAVNPADVLLSASFTSPTLPFTHDIFRRIGVVRNDSASDFLSFVQANTGKDRFYIYDDETATALNVLTGGSATAFATVSLAAFAPPTSLRSYLRITWDPDADGNEVAFRVPGSSVVDVESYTIVNMGDVPGVQPYIVNRELRTDASQDIEYEVDSALDNVDLSVVGFFDEV